MHEHTFHAAAVSTAVVHPAARAAVMARAAVIARATVVAGAGHRMPGRASRR